MGIALSQAQLPRHFIGAIARTSATGGVLLEVVPKTFSVNLDIREDGKAVGELERALVRETARLDLEDRSYSFYRDQLFGGDYILDHKGQSIARATKPMWWKADIDVELGKRSVKLRKTSLVLRRFAVIEDGRQVGTISPTWLSGAKIDLPSDWMLAERIFLFWLCALMWTRQPDFIPQIK